MSGRRGGQRGGAAGGARGGANRDARARIAADTLRILEQGGYEMPRAGFVSVADDVAAARTGTVLYEAHHVHAPLAAAVAPPPPPQSAAMRVEVTSESTLRAARRLAAASADGGDVLALNFASAKNPGGGFLKGSLAQEESLALASGLYAAINGSALYAQHRREPARGLYSHAMLYTPRCPVFRADDGRGTLLAAADVYRVAFVTAPAVNAGHARKMGVTQAEIARAMRERIERVLRVAAAHGHRTLVLGAFGCGVFKNDVRDVAGWFADALLRCDELRGRFSHVVFAVLADDANAHAFRAAFALPPARGGGGGS